MQGKVKIHDVYMQGNTLQIANKAGYTKFVDGKLSGEAKAVIISEPGNGIINIAYSNGMTQVISVQAAMKAISEGKISNARLVNGIIAPIKDRFTPIKQSEDKFNKAIETEQKEIDAEVARVKEIEEKEKTKRLEELKQKIRNGDRSVLEDNQKDKANDIIKKNIFADYEAFRPKVINGAPVDASVLREYDRNDTSSERRNAEQKLVTLLLRLKKARPFIYSMLYSLNRVVSYDIERAGASIDAIYINPEYLRDTSLEELLFVFCHEVYHIAMRHRVREGSRNHALWNVACDLYINKLLTEEFGIPEDENKAVVVKSNGINLDFSIMRYGNIVYSKYINTVTDTPESIYNELIQNYQDKQNSGDGQEQSGNGQGSNGSDQSSNSQGQQNGENEQKQNQGQGQNQKQSQGQNEQAQNGQQESGSTSDKQNGDQGDKVNFRGQEIDLSSIENDIVDDKNSSGLSDEQRANRCKSVLSRASTVHKQLCGVGGHCDSFLEREVAKALAPKVNWRTLLKNYLTAAAQTYTSYSSPDRRFLTRNMVLPGPRPEDEGALDNIKICIDTSGSIDNEALGIALAQIKQMFDVYKAKAELMYWDTEVRSSFEFDNIPDLLKHKPAGGGGTDVNCVFKQFEGRDYKIGKKPLPSVIVIFTDGYFREVDPKYKKFKNVIWIIQGNHNFHPPMGKVAPLKIED